MHQIVHEMEADILRANQKLADGNHGILDTNNIRCIEFLGAIGSGKTLLIEKIGSLLKRHGLRIGGIVGDVAGDDDYAAVAAIRDAFQDHWGHVDTPFEEDLEEWKQWIHEDEDFDTDLWFLAMDGDEIAGFCQCYPIVGEDPRVGLVDELGVRRQWRGRGIATALLQHAFGAFFERDKPIVELGVDSQSPTGATRLYEKAGMSVTWTNNVYEIELRGAS